MEQSFSSFNTSDAYLSTEGWDTNDRLGLNPSSAFRKLASLNVSVHECAAKLPSVDKINATSASMAGRSVREPRKSAPFVFDELFQLTTEFTDVMKSLSTQGYEMNTDASSKTSGDAVTQSSQSLVSSSQQLSHAGPSVSGIQKATQPRSLLSVDEATTFMIMSCHCRLTETYITIFQMMQICIENSLIPQKGKNWAVILPRLQVGSVALPPLQVDDVTLVSSRATSSMYKMTVAMLLSRLWAQLADVMRDGVGTRADSALAPRSSLVDMMWDTAMDKTDRLMQTIDSVVCLLNG